MAKATVREMQLPADNMTAVVASVKSANVKQQKLRESMTTSTAKAQKIGQSSDLGLELKTFQLRKHEWLKEHEGEYVLIKAEEDYGFFDTWADAVIAGKTEFPGTSFLVERVCENREVVSV